MEAIIFLLQTVTAGVIGHYLKKQLEKIDARLPSLFETEDPRAIEEFVHSAGLENKINKLAEDTLSNSFIIPSIPLDAATVVDRVDLFENILNFGFAYSKKIECDLLLPGSLVGPDSLTLFANNSDAVTAVKRKDLKIDLNEGGDVNSLYFIPCKSESIFEILSRYRSVLIDRRQETFDYIRWYLDMVVINGNKCFVSAVSAGSCFFRWQYAVKDYFPHLVTPVKLSNWSKGVETMLNWAPELAALGSITREEIGEIMTIYEKLKSLY